MEIISTGNAKVKMWMKYHQKKYREQDQRFLVEGQHLIEEAILANALESLIIRKGKNNIFTHQKNVYYVSDEIIDKLSVNVSKVDYIGICIQPQASFSAFEKVALFDDIQDPGNLGTMIRTAYSFGFDGIYVSKGCVDTYNEKVIRSTQGALFHIPIKQIHLKEAIGILKNDDFHVYATALRNAKKLSFFTNENKIALVFGNEGNGIHEDIIALCDASVKIEMSAFESLNVAVAAGICMYYFRKL